MTLWHCTETGIRMKRFDVWKLGPNIGLVDEMYRRYLEAPTP